MLPTFALAQSDSISRPGRGYHFENLDQGKRLRFNLTKKDSSFIKVAPHYDNAFGPGVVLNYTRPNTFLEGSRLGITTDISANPRLRSYYEVLFGKKGNFMASLFVNAEREELPFYSGDGIGKFNHSYASGGVGIRYHPGIHSNLGSDIYYRNSSPKPAKNIGEVLPPWEYLDKFIYRGPELALIYQLNTFDDPLYPTRGIRVDLKYRQAFATNFISQFNYPDSVDMENTHRESIQAYWLFDTDMESYYPLGKKASVNLEFSFGMSDNNKPFIDNFYVGGYRYMLRENQVAFVGLHSHDLLQGNYVKEKVALQVEPLSNLFLSVLFNFLFVNDDYTSFLKEFLAFGKEGRYMGAGAGVTYKSPFGPLSIYLGSRTDIWNPIWYINLGFTF